MKQLDARWFGELRTLIAQTDDVEQLQKSLQVNQFERERFLEDEIENPRFRYYYEEARLAKVDDYRTLFDRIAAIEKNEIIKKLYTKKLSAQMIRLRMMRASAEGDDEAFSKHSIDLYGTPKKEIFAYIAGRIVTQAEAATEDEQRRAAKRLLKIFSKIDTSKCTVSAEVLPAPVSDEWTRALTAKIVREIFMETLERYGIEDWQVVVDTTESRRRFSVVPNQRKIYIPSDGNLINRPRILTKLGAEAIAEHEIGVHVRRAYEGYQQPLQLLSMGLSGYLRGEEGLASYVQQQIEGATEYYGFERYLAAAVAIGLDGDPRDFRSVYAILFDYFTIVSPVSNPDREKIMMAAWDATVRVFRGTSARTPGAIYTRDLAYLEGNIGIWQLMVEKPYVFPELFVGKFDPLNKAHVSALQNLGILSEW